MKIIGRPSWWTILLFIPVINLIMFPIIWVETLRSFETINARYVLASQHWIVLYYVNTQN
jgi:signal peptidase I